MKERTAHHVPLLVGGLIASGLVFTEILMLASGHLLNVWFLMVCQLVLYAAMHELSHGIAASLFGIPIETITIGPQSLSRHVISVGDTSIRMAWIPIGMTMQLGWARFSRLQQLGLGMAGALLPLTTWGVSGWTWHVILLTGLLSWLPGMADGKLILGSRPAIGTPTVLRDSHQVVSVTDFKQSKPSLYRASLAPMSETLNAQCWVEFVSLGRRWEIAMTVRENLSDPSQVILEREGSAYPIDRRAARRRHIKIPGLLRSEAFIVPMRTRDLSRIGARIRTSAAMPNDSFITVEFQWMVWSWTRWARVLRCRREDDATWDVVALWCPKPST